MIKQSIVISLLLTGLCLLALPQPLTAAGDSSATALPTALVATDVLESRISETEAAADLTDEAKARLLELYRKALSNLQAVSSNTAAADAFIEAIKTVPAQVQALRVKLTENKVPPPLENLAADPLTPLSEIEQLLQKEQANLAAVDARRADFERRLTREQSRPAAITQRLAQVRQEQEEVAAALKVPPASDAGSTLIEATRWELDTRYTALSAEIKMLDQELISQPMRLDLLEARRDKEAASVDWLGTRVSALNERVNLMRRLEAEQSKIDAEAQQLETAGLDPLLDRLAEENAALTEDFNTGADALDRERVQAEQLAERIAADYRDVKASVESSRTATGLGSLLVNHRKSLPSLDVYERRARVREDRIAEVGVRRLRYREEARRFADLDKATAEFEAQITAEKTPELLDKLRDLVAQRQTLLQKALEADEFYLRKLREIDTTEGKLFTGVHEFDTFLSKHLLWLRTAEPTRLKDLAGLPGEVLGLFLPSSWTAIDGLLYQQVILVPYFWFALLVAATLLWKRQTLIKVIKGLAKQLGKPTTDRFQYTLQALALTLAVAAPLSLLLATVGWLLETAEQSTPLSHDVGYTLLRVAAQLFILQALRMMCIPQGLAAAHFRWSKEGLRRLRTELGRLIWIFIPAVLVLRLAANLNPAESGGTLARLALVVGGVSLSFFLYRVFNPKWRASAHLTARKNQASLLRSIPLWYLLLLAYPLWLAGLTLAGFLYSAFALSNLFVYTLWLIIALILLYELALRSLLIARRRLAYEAAMERRQAAIAARQEAEPGGGIEEDVALQYEEPGVDLAALSDESRELVWITMIGAGLIGFYLIWSSVLPALRIFDDVNLWYETVTVDGEAKQLPITLADLGLALIYAIGVVVLARRLPAMLEIVLLRYSDMPASSRYTVTTLVNYSIIAAGVLIVFNTIGAQWSQLQWLAAALSVGIGFGLQEIVANFISGLIILFERPIRIGDFVTIGDTDGVVTKIQIRATTIRNMDGKELLVPNKEFITGRLLNWSLSDQNTRILVSIGIAYGSNVREAMRLLEEAACENQNVLDDPAPSVIFQAFGDNALTLMLRCFVDTVDVRYHALSALNQAINDKFNQAGIVIAFPQRDLHLNTEGPLRVSIEDGVNAGGR